MRGGHLSPKRGPMKNEMDGLEYELALEDGRASAMMVRELRERANAPRHETSLVEFMLAFNMIEPEEEYHTLCPSYKDAVLTPTEVYSPVLTTGHQSMRRRRSRLLEQLSAAGPGKPW